MAVIGFAGMSVAQSVWTAGYYTGSDGLHKAAVYENGQKRFELAVDGVYESTGVIVLDGDVYWVKNRMENDGTSYYYADIMKNDDLYLNSPMDEHRHINALFQHDGDIYAPGCMNIDGNRTAVVWTNNNSVPTQLGDAVYFSEATCGTVADDGQLFVGGWQNTSTSFRGAVWSNGDVFYFPDNTAVFGMDYYGGDIYSVGYSYENSLYSVKVWKNDEEIGTLTSLDNDGKGIAIHVDAGDVYVAGWEGFTLKIWKNGNLIQSLPGSGECAFWDVLVNSNGVYYAGQYNGEGKVWKDGTELDSPTPCDRVYDIFIEEPTCTNLSSRTLPYFEGFEISETDWACWETSDGDDHNEGYASYWHRRGVNDPAVNPATGDYFAVHSYGPAGIEQEGWLVTPMIDLPEDCDVKLSFKSYERYAADYEYEGVWLASASNPSGTEVWHATEDEVCDAWKTFEIDLSPYKGQEVQLAFKYKGTYAHGWYIDDVNIVREYRITTEVSPTNAGTVEGGGRYPDGAQVYLTASPNTGWRFSHWNDGIVTNPREITVSGNATYTANFMQENYTITVMANPTVGGTVSGGGNNYHYGDMANLTATPASGYVFNSWSDGNTESTRTVVVIGDAVYVANFSEVGATTYTVTVTSNNTLLGTVSGSGVYPAGSTVQIQATPSSNAYFVKWDDGVTENPRIITVTSNMNFVAEFAAYHNYTITVESADPTMGSATGGGTFQEGTEIQISATPHSGYYFTSWDDGNADNPRTITVTQDATYKAQFSTNVIPTYSLTVICNTSEGSVIGSGTYAAGSNVTIAAIPNTGFEFDKWNDGSTHNPRQVTVNDNMTFVAFFKGTGIDESGETRYAVYPNPANDNIRLEGIEADSEVRIYNAMGALVKVVTVNANEEIGIGDLSAGLYMVRCSNATLRFLKK